MTRLSWSSGGVSIGAHNNHFACSRVSADTNLGVDPGIVSVTRVWSSGARGDNENSHGMLARGVVSRLDGLLFFTEASSR